MKYRIYIFFLLSIIVINTLFLPELSAEPLEDVLEKTKSEKEATQKKIEDIKKEESVYIEDVNNIEADLLSSLDDLNNLNAELADKKNIIDKTTVELVIKQEEINKIEEELNQKIEIFNNRIKVIYKSRDINTIEMLFASGDFIEFISRLKMKRLLAEKDAESISEIKSHRKLLIDSRNEILNLREREKSEKAELEKLINQAEIKKREVENIYDKKKELLSITRANKEALILMENQLAIKEKEITRALQSYSYGSAPTGKLLWPVAGKFSSGFGPRTSLSGAIRFHSGVDLYAPNGTPIYACESGQVIKAEYHGGYGYSVLIYHGGGLATFYAHLSGFAVSAGQNVSRGQLIGYVGTTGYTTGPHLHLEVRINGVPKDPMGYL
jgi:murein DD-endopeptidase MepM/ murein hydrolase activator NlpD